MGTNCFVGVFSGTFDKAIEDSRHSIGYTSGHDLFLVGLVGKLIILLDAVGGRMKKTKNRFKKTIIGLFITLVLSIFGGCSQQLGGWLVGFTDNHSLTRDVTNVETFPEFDGENDVLSVNENQPTFTEDQLSIDQGTWQAFSDLDSLNRVGEANVLLHKSMMPKEDRGDIQQVYPTGWHQKKSGINGSIIGAMLSDIN